jgi:hypothetical protein
MQNLGDQFKNKGNTGNQQSSDFQSGGNDFGAGATNPGANAGGNAGAGAGGGGDFLDKGVDYAGKKTGHSQVSFFQDR